MRQTDTFAQVGPNVRSRISGPAGTKTPPRMMSTIGEILPVAVERFGSRTALGVGDARSPSMIARLSNRVANGLVAAGVQPGDRVALYGPNCWEWLVASYGIAKTGAVVIPPTRRGDATLKLPRGRRSRPGARLVLARIVEKGVHGPKTSGAVVALAIRR